MTPITVMGEVVFEALIPYEIALLVNEMKAGCGLDRILHYGWILLLMALAALFFGYIAGLACAKSSCGFARNLRQDVFYQIQRFSFTNLDRFSSASLVTRLTTDIQNIQMAFMMLVRTAFRAPFNLLASFFYGLVHGRQHGPVLSGGDPHPGGWDCTGSPWCPWPSSGWGSPVRCPEL